MLKFSGEDARLMDLHFGYITAAKQSSDPDSLRQLASSGQNLILRRLAQNESTPGDVLAQLAQHPDTEVRARVGCNPSTPNYLVMQLARDPSDEVRFQMAGETSVFVEVLSHLAADENASVRERALRTLNGAALEWELRKSGFVMEPGTYGRLGELLVVAGVLEFEQIEEVIHNTKHEKLPLGRALVQSGLVSHATITHALNCQTLIRRGQMSMVAAIEVIRTASNNRTQ